MSAAHLSKLYKKSGIRRKAIRVMKYIPPSTQRIIPELTRIFLAELETARANGSHVCFTDEIMFTRSTNSKLEFSGPKINIERSAKTLEFPTTAVIASVSEVKGLVHYRSFPGAVDQNRYLAYLKELNAKVQDAPLVLVHDNLRVHKCRVVQQYLRENNIQQIWTVPYSPQYMPIELSFSGVKQKFR